MLSLGHLTSQCYVLKCYGSEGSIQTVVKITNTRNIEKFFHNCHLICMSYFSGLYTPSRKIEDIYVFPLSPDSNKEVLEITVLDDMSVAGHKSNPSPFHLNRTPLRNFSPTFDQSCFNLFGSPLRIDAPMINTVSNYNTVAVSPEWNIPTCSSRLILRESNITETSFSALASPAHNVETEKLFEEFNMDCSLVVSLQMNIREKEISSSIIPTKENIRDLNLLTSPERESKTLFLNPSTTNIIDSRLWPLDTKIALKCSPAHRSIRQVEDGNAGGISWNINLNETGYNSGLFQSPASERSYKHELSLSENTKHFFDRPFTQISKPKVRLEEVPDREVGMYENGLNLPGDETLSPFLGMARRQTRPNKIKAPPSSTNALTLKAKKKSKSPKVAISVFDPDFDQSEQENIETLQPTFISDKELICKIKNIEAKSKENASRTLVTDNNCVNHSEAAPSKKKRGYKRLRNLNENEPNDAKKCKSNNEMNANKLTPSIKTKIAKGSKSVSKPRTAIKTESLNGTKITNKLKSNFELDKDKSSKKYCEYCCKLFSSLKRLKRHNEKLHSNQNLFF